MLNLSLQKYKDKKGYFALNEEGNFTKWNYYTSLQLHDADTLIKANKEHDCYNSVATFKTAKRNTDNIELLTEHYIDIDNHLSPFTERQAHEFVNDVLKPCFDISLPIPSQIVFTGRGVQVHFFLKDADDIIKWQYTQRAILERVQEICYKSNALINASGLTIDAACNDAARVLRTIDTKNTKSGTYAKLIYSNDAAVYSQEEIIKDYDLQWTAERGRGKGTKHNLSELGGLSKEEVLRASQKEINEFKPYRKLYSKETLNQERKNDLFKLIELRNAAGTNEGYRNNLLSIYVQLLRESTNDADILLLQALELNEAFNSPLNEKSIVAWCKTALNKQLYFTNTYIINKLQISQEEQEQLSTIISRQVKNARYYNKNKDDILKKAAARYRPTKTVNAMKRNSCKVQAIQMRRQGYKVEEIAAKLNKNKRQILRYLKG